MQGAADVNREAFEEAESRPPQFHPPSPSNPNSHCTSLFPGNQLLDWGKGRRWYSISGLWITVPCSVFFLWWFGCLAGWVAGRRRNVLLSRPQHWGADWKTGTRGCWVITRPRGCLFKPKSCLDYCTVIVLQLRGSKDRELEIERRKKRGKAQEKERSTRGGGQAGREKGERRSGLCHPSFPVNYTNNKKKGGSPVEQKREQCRDKP